ncbi:MAG TPA: DUF2934 domain-containing protein [Bryobacteraceae bacterium]|nr:DUF2934 domain-containing protein [Bryobacteraceae bacterium]
MVALEQRLTGAEAWQQYRTAFQEFARNATRVQVLTAQPNPDRTAVEAALVELEKARVTYNQSRDALAQQLLASDAHLLPRAEPGSESESTGRIKELAELLWEVSGRPSGTADHDWYRAEEIVRRASAG